MKISTIGLDLAKSVFQIHGVDDRGKVLVKRALRRGQVLRFFAQQEPCLIGMEACSSAHYWGRQLAGLGHAVRLLPPAEVKPYVKRGKKSDAADAEAICEAVQRPRILAVPVKTAAQQAVLVQHRTRDLLVRQRTMQVNALRSHLAEFGLVAAKGTCGFKSLLEHLRSAGQERLPKEVRQALLEMAGAIEALERRITSLEKALVKACKANPVAHRLMTIPGVGPITASAVAAMVADPAAFDNGRHFAAWLGLVPRQHGTGGKLRLGPITKKGDRYLRRLLVLGATSLLRRAKPEASPLDAWAAQLLSQGKKARLVSVALANKMARIVWALLAKEEDYKPASAA